jgi:hypothetical protein
MIHNMLQGLAKLRDNSVKRRRISSHHPEHKNYDFFVFKRKERKIFAEIRGAGCITHFWCTIDNSDPYYLRKLVLRVYWDGEEYPSVEVPIGDFFGMGHAMCKNYWSFPLAMSPKDGKGFNCWWPMPFGKSARFELDNQTKRSTVFYFYIDYEEYDTLEDDYGRFHAVWNRLNPCEGISDEGMSTEEFLLQGINDDFSKNYVLMEAEGKGHYVGCNLNIHNLREQKDELDNWPGEGDDMFFIDGDDEQTIFGTGTEDYFGTAWCPSKEFSTPFYGIILGGGKYHSGKITYYRYHIMDPVYFTKSIKVTIEHGHANRRSDDYSSTAYWYQAEPHKPFKVLPNAEDRIPRDTPKEIDWK